ncbi:uncharacterized protein NEMAJ01_0232 [Nematocida major]|uniref:uncharacterized protein n=1 Tax=Nematocida major TaxID=1912982 RepID=UPI0020074E93|nr:uncharacterized protein NEMAJ01_0232 [Nematocida major]KAH9385336.1 hypothetical protein NEMAJ01_0232 [Nematocida major]
MNFRLWTVLFCVFSAILVLVGSREPFYGYGFAAKTWLPSSDIVAKEASKNMKIEGSLWYAEFKMMFEKRRNQIPYELMIEGNPAQLNETLIYNADYPTEIYTHRIDRAVVFKGSNVPDIVLEGEENQVNVYSLEKKYLLHVQSKENSKHVFPLSFLFGMETTESSPLYNLVGRQKTSTVLKTKKSKLLFMKRLDDLDAEKPVEAKLSGDGEFLHLESVASHVGMPYVHRHSIKYNVLVIKTTFTFNPETTLVLKDFSREMPRIYFVQGISEKDHLSSTMQVIYYNVYRDNLVNPSGEMVSIFAKVQENGLVSVTAMQSINDMMKVVAKSEMPRLWAKILEYVEAHYHFYKNRKVTMWPILNALQGVSYVADANQFLDLSMCSNSGICFKGSLSEIQKDYDKSSCPLFSKIYSNLDSPIFNSLNSLERIRTPLQHLKAAALLGETQFVMNKSFHVPLDIGGAVKYPEFFENKYSLHNYCKNLPAAAGYHPEQFFAGGLPAYADQMVFYLSFYAEKNPKAEEFPVFTLSPPLFQESKNGSAAASSSKGSIDRKKYIALLNIHLSLKTELVLMQQRTFQNTYNSLQTVRNPVLKTVMLKKTVLNGIITQAISSFKCGMHIRHQSFFYFKKALEKTLELQDFKQLDTFLANFKESNSKRKTLSVKVLKNCTDQPDLVHQELSILNWVLKIVPVSISISTSHIESELKELLNIAEVNIPFEYYTNMLTLQDVTNWLKNMNLYKYVLNPKKDIFSVLSALLNNCIIPVQENMLAISMHLMDSIAKKLYAAAEVYETNSEAKTSIDTFLNMAEDTLLFGIKRKKAEYAQLVHTFDFLKQELENEMYTEEEAIRKKNEKAAFDLIKLYTNIFEHTVPEDHAIQAWVPPSVLHINLGTLNAQHGFSGRISRGLGEKVRPPSHGILHPIKKIYLYQDPCSTKIQEALANIKSIDSCKEYKEAIMPRVDQKGHISNPSTQHMPVPTSKDFNYTQKELEDLTFLYIKKRLITGMFTDIVSEDLSQSMKEPSKCAQLLISRDAEGQQIEEFLYFLMHTMQHVISHTKKDTELSEEEQSYSYIREKSIDMFSNAFFETATNLMRLPVSDSVSIVAKAQLRTILLYMHEKYKNSIVSFFDKNEESRALNTYMCSGVMDAKRCGLIRNASVQTIQILKAALENIKILEEAYESNLLSDLRAEATPISELGKFGFAPPDDMDATLDSSLENSTSRAQRATAQMDRHIKDAVIEIKDLLESLFVKGKRQMGLVQRKINKINNCMGRTDYFAAEYRYLSILEKSLKYTLESTLEEEDDIFYIESLGIDGDFEDDADKQQEIFIEEGPNEKDDTNVYESALGD